MAGIGIEYRYRNRPSFILQLPVSVLTSLWTAARKRKNRQTVYRFWNSPSLNLIQFPISDLRGSAVWTTRLSVTVWPQHMGGSRVALLAWQKAKNTISKSNISKTFMKNPYYGVFIYFLINYRNSLFSHPPNRRITVKNVRPIRWELLEKMLNIASKSIVYVSERETQRERNQPNIPASRKPFRKQRHWIIAA